MLIIETLVPGSFGEKIGLQAGDRVIEINGEHVEDELDWHFLAADDKVALTIQRNSSHITLSRDNHHDEDLGVTFTPFKYRNCGCKCIFCFVEQLPSGLRETLYFKDEDYRLSFLYGNYVTLTNVRQKDLERIVRRRLSPLYVSIHAVNPEVRKFILGIRKDDHLLDKIQFLAENGIELHGQIVVCPEINDGTVLKDTCERLYMFYPNLKTVSIVPVGLTKFRKELPAIRGFKLDDFRAIVPIVHTWQKKFFEKSGNNFIYLSDEMYLRGGYPLPRAKKYDGFDQIENGVGLTRYFLTDFHHLAKKFPKKLPAARHLVMVTGMLAYPVLFNEIVPVLQRINNLNVELLPVKNKFLGDEITVSGLLSGRDILAVLQDSTTPDQVLLPPRCLNHDGFFLDDVRPEDLERELKCPVGCYTENFLLSLLQTWSGKQGANN